MKFISRLVEQRLHSYLTSFRIVVVNGPRQAGKTTLLRMCQQHYGGEYRSLDDEAELSAALTDPMTFATAAQRPLLVDEVQRGGDALIHAIKYAVDQDGHRGQYVLSGSTRFLTVPTLSESLAGRATIMELWPLSMAERVGDSGNFCDQLFIEPADLLGHRSLWERVNYLDLMCGGSYPEVVTMVAPSDQRSWFDSYLTTVINRDIREFAQIHQAQALPRLLELVAARSGSTTVTADLARSLNISVDTTRNYLSYLETVFLVTQAPAWSTNLTSKISKTPKVFITDAGLTAYLLRVDARALYRPGNPATGILAETFVFTELMKLRAAASTSFEIRHLRDRDGREIDFVLESWNGDIVAIEVKASATPQSEDARHLRWLRDRLGDRFVAGVVIHMGQSSLSFGDRIYALPISTFWNHAQLT